MDQDPSIISEMDMLWGDQGSLFDEGVLPVPQVVSSGVPGPVEVWLEERYPEVGARQFYRDLFPEGELEQRRTRSSSGGFVYEDGKYHGVAVRIACTPQGREQRFRYSVTDDLDVIDDLTGSNDFCVMSPVSFAGMRQTSAMVRNLYALVIDLDSLVIKDGYARGMEILIYQMTEMRQTTAARWAVPVPTYIVSSGTGIHLYYLFERPVPLFRNVVEQLRRMRRALIDLIWNEHVTTLSRNRQYESVTQGFRMVGTMTKNGRRVRAFRVGDRVTVEYLNEHLEQEARLTRFAYKSNLTLEEAKEKYPDWYERRVVQRQPRGTWTVKRDLYEWWKRVMVKQAVEGHRYFCVMALAVYAAKCAVPFDEVRRDAYTMVESLSKRGKQPFTRDDADKALRAYSDDYRTFPRAVIEQLTAIPIPPNKRNGRTREQHVTLLNATRKMRRDVLGEDEYRNSGRPKKRDMIRQYARDHPDANHSQIARALGVSRPTVIKWLRTIEDESHAPATRTPCSGSALDRTRAADSSNTSL